MTPGQLVDFAAVPGHLFWPLLPSAAYCRGRCLACDANCSACEGRSTRHYRRRICARSLPRLHVLVDPVDAVYSRDACTICGFLEGARVQRIVGVLRPGGCYCCAIRSFPSSQDQAQLLCVSWFAGAASSPEEGSTRDEFEAHLRQEYGTFTPGLSSRCCATRLPDSPRGVQPIGHLRRLSLL